jgi:hypothetical protein
LDRANAAEATVADRTQEFHKAADSYLRLERENRSLSQRLEAAERGKA